jgi:hypothetical protein
MNHAQRETPQDKANEENILKLLARHRGCDYQQVMTLGKYKIDGWLHQDKRVLAWVECKWLTKEGFYGLNVPKFIEGCELAAHTDTPFLYACRVPGKVGLLEVHNGAWSAVDADLRLAGGRREPQNWDDIEPMMMFDPSLLTWFATK